MPKKIRLDQALVEGGITSNRDEASRLIMAGRVLIKEQVVLQPFHMIEDPSLIRLKNPPRFVSRGGEKLQAGFETFPLSVDGRICADIGSSTGGFTDCLLQNGAGKVYAVDVGYGLLEWRLRNDSRVVVMERTNARELRSLPDPIDFFSVDVSFISLKKILPAAVQLFGNSGGEALILIKPQFEATREEAAKGAGVIKDPQIHQRVLMEILDFAAANHFYTKGLIRSPLKGPEGNIEFLAWLEYPSNPDQKKSIQDRISDLY
jgi:23S rRNA (cytidine1920-2'-O)/16S rRNA (cytidine1409-2'-O)-methyltransferase